VTERRFTILYGPGETPEFTGWFVQDKNLTRREIK
jgi:hypothetical protein